MSETNPNKEVLVKYIRDNSGKALSMAQYAEPGTPNPEPKTYYFIYNAHGDVTGLTDSSGNTVATYTYDEFGNQQSSTGTVYNPLRYSGANNAYYDSETSLFKMGVRYYDSSTGRWITRDALEGISEQPDTLNKYVYVRNNPLTRIDPTGYWDADKHHYKWTRNIARNMFSVLGIRLSYANVMASANRHEDSFGQDALFKPKNHFNFSGSLKRRYKRSMKTAVRWWRRGSRHCASAEIGRGLHSLQDSHAHPPEIRGYIRHGAEFIEFLGRRYKLIDFLAKVEGGKFKGTYDNPYWRKGRARNAKRHTKRYIRMFLKKAYG